jgi:ubiquinone/menaquinone biosynthesis C-methylase UbiE
LGIQPGAEPIGADYCYATLDGVFSALPEVPLLQFDLAKCPLPDRFVDEAVAQNVLEHIDDDEAALHLLFRILLPRGIACIEVPVGPDSYDMYDMGLGHFRRYRVADLTLRLRRIGFEMVESWLRKWIYLPFGVRCIVTRRRP